MGGAVGRAINDYEISVKTGDVKNAGMDSDVKITLFDSEGNSSPAYFLDNKFRNDFERGNTDTFYVSIPSESPKLKNVHKIQIWRNDKGIGPDWFVDHVVVKDNRTEKEYEFPIHRWIKAFVDYIIVLYDTSLPANDHTPEERLERLDEKRSKYIFEKKDPRLPAQVKDMPEDELFSFEYKWDIISRKAKLILTAKLVNIVSAKWDNLSQIKKVYTRKTLPTPLGAINWKDDGKFAQQRTHGCSVGLIKRCLEIPDKLGVTDEMLSPFMEELTIAEAISQKRLFMVDLEILSGIKHVEDIHICTPIALFFETFQKKLMPIAIQLEQEKGPDNPVFLPTDPEYTWTMAKMWFNNSDATYHQSCSHLGFTHLMMEGVSISANRHLSQSHPLYKLLAPHFLYIIAINTRALRNLTSPGGWIDKTMSCGVEGLYDLVQKGTSKWRFDVEGTIPEEISRRNVLDCLTDYPFRDDALLVYEAIRNYVTKYVNLYYDCCEAIHADWELQMWIQELTDPHENNGCGYIGIPGNLETTDQLITLLTCIISTCSISHAAANFPQYDQYGFPPNYPSKLYGRPPKSKDALTEQDILNALPDKTTCLDIMVVGKILSDRGTKPLGDFEVQYIFDPAAKSVVEEFRQELKEVAKIIEERNLTRETPYTILHPSDIPNSISI